MIRRSDGGNVNDDIGYNDEEDFEVDLRKYETEIQLNTRLLLQKNITHKTQFHEGQLTSHELVHLDSTIDI